MNLLLDTNVLIDYLGRKPPFFEAAEGIVAAGFFGDAKLWTAAQSLKDAFYVLEHYLDSIRVQRVIVKACEVITPVGISAEDTLQAARLEWEDYEDCLIALCASKAKADYLITRDKKGFQRSPVPTLSPEEWLQRMEKTQGLAYGSIGI